jgi:putative phosphoribosyl transferase
MAFRNREEAGRLLAHQLSALRGKQAIVLGLPRGGVAVARPIADLLGLPLDVMVTRKLSAPGQAEFAIGAVSASGERVLNEQALRYMVLPPGYLEAETQRQRDVALRREATMRGIAPRQSVTGKIAILVDDGIATGMTMMAAIAAVRAMHPSEVVIAAPVIAPETLTQLNARADRVVALAFPDPFDAVGEFYQDFTQVTDLEVLALLTQPVP